MLSLIGIRRSSAQAVHLVVWCNGLSHAAARHITRTALSHESRDDTSDSQYGVDIPFLLRLLYIPIFSFLLHLFYQYRTPQRAIGPAYPSFRSTRKSRIKQAQLCYLSNTVEENTGHTSTMTTRCCSKALDIIHSTNPYVQQRHVISTEFSVPGETCGELVCFQAFNRLRSQ